MFTLFFCFAYLFKFLFSIISASFLPTLWLFDNLLISSLLLFPIIPLHISLIYHILVLRSLLQSFFSLLLRLLLILILNLLFLRFVCSTYLDVALPYSSSLFFLFYAFFLFDFTFSLLSSLLLLLFRLSLSLFLLYLTYTATVIIK